MTIERKSKQKIKGVAFNLDDKADKELLEYAESQGKFSAYVKRLIAMDRALSGNWAAARTIIDDDNREEATAKEPEEDELDLADLDDEFVD